MLMSGDVAHGSLCRCGHHSHPPAIVIEQAKGMVAERAGLNMELAFSALRAYARNHNLRLVDVAGSVIDGTLAPSALGPAPRPGPARRKDA
jgi:hypothetical protein